MRNKKDLQREPPEVYPMPYHPHCSGGGGGGGGGYLSGARSGAKSLGGGYLSAEPLPPVNRQSGNITFPHTPFVGGKIR